MATEDRQNQKGLNKEILTIGIPSFLETLATTFANMIDSKMVSALGVTAISAVSVTNAPRLFFYSIFMAMNTVIASLVAKYNGKKDQEAGNQVFDHALKLTVILSIVLGVLAVLLAKPIMILFSGEADTLEDSILYFRIVMGGMIFNLVFLAINASLRGVGKTKLTFLDNVVACGVNLLCNYLLIEGHWGFPAWGIKGAAIATVLGNVAACIVSIVFMFNKKLFINIPYCISKRYHMTKESLKEFVTNTRSCAIDNIAMRATLLAISGVTARIGSFQMAIYSVGTYLLNVNFAMGNGLQTASVTLIGRSYGEGNEDHLYGFRRAILKIGLIASIALALVIIFGGRFFYAFFSTDEEFITIGGYSCIFIGIITIFQVIKFINTGCLQGIGKMKEVAFCSIVSFAGVNLGLVALLVLVFKIGIWGVWIGTLCSQATQAFMLWLFIRKVPAFSKKPSK